MKNSRMSVKGFVGYKAGVDYDPKRVREGPEFKCFNCNKWFPGSLTYYLSKDWRPTLKYNINFLCGPKCATALSGKD
jgi:hypothetical protein